MYERPVLVIDEFNPTDFGDDKWPDGKDYSIKQLSDEIGDAFLFWESLPFQRTNVVVLYPWEPVASQQLAPCTK
jgi:hypothetical protein